MRPVVSMATGLKRYAWPRCAYFPAFISSAAATTFPDALVAIDACTRVQKNHGRCHSIQAAGHISKVLRSCRQAASHHISKDWLVPIVMELLQR